MSAKNITVLELLSRLRLYFQESDFTKKYADEEPLRAELYNAYQMQQHGKAIAKIHKVTTGRAPNRLLKRLADNEKILFEIRDLLTDSVNDKNQITPGAEWLLDNFYLIEEQVRLGKRHLPKGYSEGLPRLINGRSSGYPRVYDIALEIISHSDGRVDMESLTGFIQAYQSVTDIELGELWAIPIMLRLALIENLRRVSTRIAIGKVNRDMAAHWANQMIETSEQDPKNLILVIADMARSAPPMESSFVAELTRRLAWKGPALALPLTWVEQRLSESGLATAELVNLENQKQAASQVSISNSISSLRFISSIEWREFVESNSIVEQTLRKDPAGIYAAMDFYTRDNYRHVVERIAKRCALPESNVSDIVLHLCNESIVKNGDKDRSAHVGYYLIDKGLSHTEKLVNFPLTSFDVLKKKFSSYPLAFYLSIISIVTIFFTAIALATAYTSWHDTLLLVLVSIFSLLGASQLAIAMVNWALTLQVKGQPLPRMDFSEGIPAGYKTLVVVPSLFTGTENIEQLVEGLEVRFLANKDENLHFALLSDFTDAHSETLPGDEQLLAFAQKKIEALNEKYSSGKDVFFLFHRPRKWNPHDRIWMGYERKRGKLTELNALLRSKDGREFFSLIVGDMEALDNVKYIITLDTDTQLPRGAAWMMVATMAHPLNQALYSEDKQRVVEGYGILQPRVEVSMPAVNASLYERMNANEPGIDPYTRITSDVYQDIFGEGSFIGKGIYDLDIFERAINSRFPENRILSHDLLEGCYAGSGLVSDIVLYEEYPGSYAADVSRRHRWMRGDWQIAWWFLPMVPSAVPGFKRNTLSALSRWKIFDNIRRSLVPIAMMLLLLLGWALLNASWFWTLSVIGVVILPSVIGSAWSIIKKPSEISMHQHVNSILWSFWQRFIQNIFLLACLPYEAFYSIDAILRTSWRMLVSHKKLLEWRASGLQQNMNDKTLLSAYVFMWVNIFIVICCAVYLGMYAPIRITVASPLLIMWALAPGIAWYIGRPYRKQEIQLTTGQIAFLHKLSRKTWAFFENFVVADENWLPPDNYQEDPKDMIAHRTSPTNIGLSLLANMAAYDFGYITVGRCIERTGNTVATIEKLERYCGHFYNWYDTISLVPLYPRYISTVDSGNLAGHVLTLRQGILAMPNQKVIDVKIFDGLCDTLDIIHDQVGANKIVPQCKAFLSVILGSPAGTLQLVYKRLNELMVLATEMRDSIDSEDGKDTWWWADAFSGQVQDALSELILFAPWLVTEFHTAKAQVFVSAIGILSFHELAGLEQKVFLKENAHQPAINDADEDAEMNDLRNAVVKGAEKVRERIMVIENLAMKCNGIADMEYDFLYDSSKNLLAIGYNVEDERRDTGFYDLLASEARLCVFVAISQGKLPQESWFALGRLLAGVGGEKALISWSGSMFEYLMPLLIMPEYENTLLYQTNKVIVDRQIEYGNQHGVPWGVSESGYNRTDADLNYQYRAFGVPGLGLKRGLGEDLVIAPYASAMALMVSPHEACVNMELLKADGFEGRFGFYEAIDYTVSRLPRGRSNAIVRSFMVHHQGMSFLSLAHVLLGQPMQKRFEAELQFQASLLLLQEKVPIVAVVSYTYASEMPDISTMSENAEIRTINTPDTQIPEVQLLSNGKYNVMVSNAGGGYSRWKDIAVTRWREDATCDNWGAFLYIYDLDNKTFWSTAYQPTLKKAKHYEATFTQGRAEFRRIDNHIETYTEIVVSPEDDVEMRRVHITNRSGKRRSISVTSYAEVVLAPAVADALHPAFSDLFVQTEIMVAQHAIICTRRPRSAEEQAPWMCHILKAHDTTLHDVSYETDRMQFIGRGNTIANPDAMNEYGRLSNTEGPVLDPIVAIRHKIVLEPGQSAVFDMILGVSDTRDGCRALIYKYQDRHLADRVLELAWTHSHVVLRQINASESDAQLYGRLAGSIIYPNPLMRADQDIILSNTKGQSGLWGYSVSGDLPIVLLKIRDADKIDLVKQLVRAHAYWRLKGLAVDLMIWNEDAGGYRNVLQDDITALITANVGTNLSDRPGNIFLRQGDQLSKEDRVLFETVARIIISDEKGTLSDQAKKRAAPKALIPIIEPVTDIEHFNASIALPGDLLFFNGTGGFSTDGREYIINSVKGRLTPAPWANVLANPVFGSVISESGQSYTWAGNAHEQRLTPWNNDPVCDNGGENFYLRDEETGYVWSPTQLPVKGDLPYITKHGFGYSIFEHIENGIHSEMTVFVDIEQPVKYIVLKLRNDSGETRRLSATGYIEWVLGDLRSRSVMHIVTEADAGTGALFAKNPYSAEFGGQVAFFDVDDITRTYTCDRTEFLGRNGTYQAPDAMGRVRLSGKTGARLDPCAAIQATFELLNDQEREIVFRLGTGRDQADAANKVRRFRGADHARNALEQVKAYWSKTLGAVQIQTPDDSLNLLTNGWLTYQTIVCRLWARSGYYQSGGAYGFRDQLQDVLSLMHTDPSFARAQILLCASRQFREGDVQHWWHPPGGQGVRTRCSDDFLWLPYVTSHYVIATNDTDVLNEQVYFLEGRELHSFEESYYDMPLRSYTKASLYEHCVLAIKRGLRFGVHGLPLFGSGDWNDGMDRVGREGKGESVWLAFFLYDVLVRFISIAKMRGDDAFAETCQKEAEQLKKNINENGWDGNWYRRGYFDDGTPLGSATNEECQIDSISQSWAVLSGAGDAAKSAMGIANADKRLVHEDDEIIQLLTPPFDKSAMNPGYIKGYLPGIRENGGQYTHSAVWLTMAIAALGDAERAWQLMAMINPLNHADTPEKVKKYKVEPYVVAADIYAVAPHTGRGGWTWYTGSAGWMYQLILNVLLGIKLEADKLRFEPCVPAGWDSFKINYCFRQQTIYHITFLRKNIKDGDFAVTLDGVGQPDKMIPLTEDHIEHFVEVAI